MPIRHGGILASRCFNLATRPLLTQHDCTTAIEADDVEGVLADIDTDYGNCVVEIVGHSVLLVFGAPCQLRSLTGQEHGRTTPLPEVAGHHVNLAPSPLSGRTCRALRRCSRKPTSFSATSADHATAAAADAHRHHISRKKPPAPHVQIGTVVGSYPNKPRSSA